MNAQEKLAEARTAVDHLLLGVADLDAGISWVERITGVKAVHGGSHPGAGTRNALISLGGRQYLEIIAPDPTQTSFNFQIDLRSLVEPRLITWAARTSDIGAIAKIAREAGLESAPRDGSRARPDGKILRWRSVRLPNQPGRQSVEVIPFFIEWAPGSVHPSQDSPAGCQLQSLDFEHPDPAGVVELLRKFGLRMNGKEGKVARLRATLKTPKGLVELR